MNISMRARCRWRVAGLVAMLVAARAHAATDWPEFRGPTGQGVSDVANVPVKWSKTENVAWKVKVPGSGWSSPVLAGGKVYLTAGVPGAGRGPVTLHALCLDAADGKTIWDAEVFQPDPGALAQMQRKNSPASPTPVFRDGRLYVHFGHMGTAALDAVTGKVLWRQAGLSYRPAHGAGSSPVLVDDLLIFTADGADQQFVAALEVATGAVKWKTPRGQTAGNPFSFCTPLPITVGNERQVVAPGSGYAAAYEPATGREIWRVRYGEGYSVVPRPVFAHGLVYVCSGFNQPALYAVRVEGARGDVTNSHVAWKTDKQAPLTPSPLVVGDDLYLVADKGFATCADARTGKVRWSERLGGNYSASPLLAGGHVYFMSESGTTTVIKPGPTFDVVARNELGERALASFAAADGALFIRTESHLWKIGE